MKAAGLLLIFGSIVAMVVGTFLGCGNLFAWNGRHPILAEPITLGTPLEKTFLAKRETRYTAGVEVVFAKEGLPRDPGREGMVLVDAKLPLVARITDGGGQAGTQLTGWLEPSLPPTVLYGQARADAVVAERLVGPWRAPRDEQATLVVDLGPDRVGAARIVEARVVLYDDKTPSNVTLPFVGVAAGSVGFFAGIGLIVTARFRRRISRHRPSNSRPPAA